ncbi:hypothetical protein [Streptococcus cuniculi]|uniref:DUF4352 domain-containing protein n=1 Tax=Streptococcus cuniculi TaxID=1432788 RepID=A0A4Y9J6X2_9STRE|nr:hypothetical protein [Streptococcus cuniculi]MBF0779224.1 hypothetical protein [Streptococcus cuniculi]TFU96773.1 hypothetical protein E4T82_10950 [Streptococcus cuniculi]
MFPKEFIVEDGHVYYRKKPLHKQPLFWTTIAGGVVSLILGVLLFVTILVIASSSDSSSYVDSTYDDTVSDLLFEKEIGQEVSLENGLKLTVQSMDLDENADLATSYYDTALVVNVQVNNPTKRVLYFDERSSIVFGTQYSDSEEIDSVYPLDNLTYDANLKKKVAPEETVTYTLFYGVDDSPNYRLIYEENMWNFQQAEKL